jgi:hypothetical protein
LIPRWNSPRREIARRGIALHLAPFSTAADRHVQDKLDSGAVWWLEAADLVRMASDQRFDRYEGDRWEELIEPWVEIRNSVSISYFPAQNSARVGGRATTDN